MTIKQLQFGDELWEYVSEYADQCSWSAGKNLAKRMKENAFCEWERVFTALNGDLKK